MSKRGRLDVNLNVDIEPFIKRLFLWVSPTLRVEIATGVSAVGFYLLLRSGLLLGIWEVLLNCMTSGAYIAAALFVLLLLVPGAGLVLPPLSLAVKRLRGKARGFVAFSSSIVLTVGLVWSAVAYGRLADSGPVLLGFRIFMVLCVVAAIEAALVLIGSVMLVNDRSLLDQLFGEPRVDPRLICANLAIVAAFVVVEETTGALGPATVAMASLNLCGVSARLMPDRPAAPAEAPAYFDVPSEMPDEP